MAYNNTDTNFALLSDHISCIFLVVCFTKLTSLRKDSSADASEANVIDLNNIKHLRQRVSQLEKALDESRINVTNANVNGSRKFSGDDLFLLFNFRISHRLAEGVQEENKSRFRSLITHFNSGLV